MDKIWDDIYDIIKRKYAENEIKQIIMKWDSILNMTTSIGRSEKLMLDLRYRIRILKYKVSVEGVEILGKCLYILINTGKCSAKELNNLFYKNNISYNFPLTLQRIEKVFISHAYIDKEYARVFRKFLISIGLDGEKEILCSSIEECALELCGVVEELLKKELIEHNIYAIFLLSKNFWESNFCPAEMGAIWVLSIPHISIYLPGYEENNKKRRLFEGEVGIKLDDDLEFIKERIKKLQKKIVQMFQIDSRFITGWESGIDEFLNQIEQFKRLEHEKERGVDENV